MGGTRQRPLVKAADCWGAGAATDCAGAKGRGGRWGEEGGGSGEGVRVE